MSRLANSLSDGLDFRTFIFRLVCVALLGMSVTKVWDFRDWADPIFVRDSCLNSISCTGFFERPLGGGDYFSVMPCVRVFFMRGDLLGIGIASHVSRTGKVDFFSKSDFRIPNVLGDFFTFLARFTIRYLLGTKMDCASLKVLIASDRGNFPWLRLLREVVFCASCGGVCFSGPIAIAVTSGATNCADFRAITQTGTFRDFPIFILFSFRTIFRDCFTYAR